MALVKPFFNTIPAMDATQTNTISINVLGGDKITGFGYTIYSQDPTNVVITAEVPVWNDVASDSIRSFPIQIGGNILQNNKNYSVIGYTFNETDNSPYSTAQFFKCYTTPKLTISLINSSTAANVFNGDTAKLNLSFDTVDKNSSALFNDAIISAYGISKTDGQPKIIYGPNTIYSLGEFEISGFEPTSEGENPNPLPNAPYSSYEIKVVGTTTDLTTISYTLSNLLCVYSQTTGTEYLVAQNLCNEGRVMLTGKVEGLDNPIASAEIRRQEVGKTEWITIKVFTQEMIKSIPFVFTAYDNLNASNTSYIYRLVVFDTLGNEQAYDTAEIFSYFNKAYVCDQENMYDLTSDFSLGGGSFVQQSAVQLPYGTVFPFVSYNSTLKYHQGQSSSVLLAPSSLLSANLDRAAQVKLIQSFCNWMANKKPKVLKDFNGNIFIVAITDSISTEYYKELGNGLASISFSWVEISDFTQENLDNVDLNTDFIVNSGNFIWIKKTWNGLTGFYGHNVWTDGDNIYYSSSSSQYVLNKATSTWEPKTWNGLTGFYGSYVWTDGDNIYYSKEGANYVLNTATSTWEPKTWNGLTGFYGHNVWTDGDNIYYSSQQSLFSPSQQYVLNTATDTWEPKTWGNFQISGDNIWTDGENIYCSTQNTIAGSPRVQAVLNKATSTWEPKTWNGLDDFFGSDIWTDGENIYCSTQDTIAGSPRVQAVLNKATSTWEPKTWNGLTDFYGSYVWTEGDNIYYSGGSSQYVLQMDFKE